MGINSSSQCTNTDKTPRTRSDILNLGNIILQSAVDSTQCITGRHISPVLKAKILSVECINEIDLEGKDSQ